MSFLSRIGRRRRHHLNELAYLRALMYSKEPGMVNDAYANQNATYPSFYSVIPGAATGTQPVTPQAPNPYGVTIGLNPGCGNPATPYAFWSNLFADMNSLNLKTLRFQVSWCSIQINQGDPPSVWSWAALDDAVAQCNAARINIVFPLRVPPSWTLAQVSQRGNTEPFYFPNSNGTGDVNSFAYFAQQVATRYNGQNGHGHIDAFEVGNEDFNIHHTSVVDTLTLNQTLNSGTAYTSFAINASGFTPLSGTKLYMSSYSSSDIFTLSANVNLNDTTVSVTSFAPGATYTAGTSIKIAYVGTNNSTYALYNGLSGVTTLNKPEPGRDPHFFSPVLKACYPVIKAAYPGVRVGMCAMWWVQPTNIGGIPNTPISNYAAFLTQMYADGCKGFFDYANFHFYSGTDDPSVGDAQTISFSQALTDIKGVIQANNDTVKVRVTEFGWSVPADTNFATQASRFSYVYNTARSSGIVEQLDFFTLDYKTSGISPSSIIQWDGGAYIQEPAYATIQSFTTTYPTW